MKLCDSLFETFLNETFLKFQKFEMTHLVSQQDLKQDVWFQWTYYKYITSNFWTFDILTFDFLLKAPQPGTAF